MILVERCVIVCIPLLFVACSGCLVVARLLVLCWYGFVWLVVGWRFVCVRLALFVGWLCGLGLVCVVIGLGVCSGLVLVIWFHR